MVFKLFNIITSLILSRKVYYSLNTFIYTLYLHLVLFYYVNRTSNNLLSSLSYIINAFMNIKLICFIYNKIKEMYIHTEKIIIKCNNFLQTNITFLDAYYLLLKWLIGSIHHFSTNSIICLSYFCALICFFIEINWLLVYTSICHSDDDEFFDYLIETLWVVKPEWFYEDLFINYKYFTLFYMYELPLYYLIIYLLNTNYIYNLFGTMIEYMLITFSYKKMQLIMFEILLNCSIHEYIWFYKNERALEKNIVFYKRLTISCGARDAKEAGMVPNIAANKYIYGEFEFCLLSDNIFEYEHDIDVEQYINNK